VSNYFSWQHAILKSKLEPTTKHVCLTIGCHMAQDGSGCFPSYNLIAEETGLSRRCVIEHVRKAADAGYLEVDNRMRENGSQSSNIYRPCMGGGGEPAALGGVQEDNWGGYPSSLGGGYPAAPLITNHSSNYPLNSVTSKKNGASDGKQSAKGRGQTWEGYIGGSKQAAVASAVLAERVGKKGMAGRGSDPFAGIGEGSLLGSVRDMAGLEGGK
jgi:hypothetical protein